MIRFLAGLWVTAVPLAYNATRVGMTYPSDNGDPDILPGPPLREG
ncbi:hypothetical protein N9H60_03405 [Flavimaricola sp.]|nr:hypothetical protein [Flavimaricola sp.]